MRSLTLIYCQHFTCIADQFCNKVRKVFSGHSWKPGQLEGILEKFWNPSCSIMSQAGFTDYVCSRNYSWSYVEWRIRLYVSSVKLDLHFCYTTGPDIKFSSQLPSLQNIIMTSKDETQSLHENQTSLERLLLERSVDNVQSFSVLRDKWSNFYLTYFSHLPVFADLYRIWELYKNTNFMFICFLSSVPILDQTLNW